MFRGFLSIKEQNLEKLPFFSLQTILLMIRSLLKYKTAGQKLVLNRNNVTK